MANLVGSLATYEGDENEQVLISVPSIIAGCNPNDPTVPDFLRAVVGDACDPYFTTQGAAISAAQAAAEKINLDPFSATSCDWMAYYGPLVFYNSFTIVPTPNEQDDGYWRIFGIWIHVYRTRVFPIPSNNCWEATTRGGARFCAGPRPVIVGSTPNTPYCFWDDNHESFTNNGLSPISGPYSDFFIRTGTGTVTYLGPSEDGGPPTTYLQGNVFMPIPPIPDNYPAPPPPPPLQGSAIVEALSDDDCITIVERGGGFRTITDIANEYETEPSENRDDYHVRTDSPYAVNVDYIEQILQQISVEFWQTLDLGQGTGGGDYVLTLQKMINAYDAANDDTQTSWLQKNTKSWILFDLLNAFVLADTTELAAPVRQSLKTAVESNKVLLPGVVTSDPTSETSDLDISWDIQFKAYMKLKLGRDTMGGANDFATLLARYCDGDRNFDVPILTYRKPDGTLVTSAPFMQLLLDTMYQIRECCNPCNEAISDNQFDENFWADHTSFGDDEKTMSMEVPDIYRVTFQVLENNFPKAVFFGTPPLQLLAKFSWLDTDGRFGPIQYVNLNAATFTAPSPNMRGYLCHCYPGVALHASVNQRGGASHVSPNSPP